MLNLLVALQFIGSEVQRFSVLPDCLEDHLGVGKSDNVSRIHLSIYRTLNVPILVDEASHLIPLSHTPFSPIHLARKDTLPPFRT